MAFNLKPLGKLYSLLYTDKMDITNAEEVVQGNSDNSVYPDEPQQVDIPCRMSFSNHDTAKDSNSDYESVNIHAVIFCANEIQVPVGSKITVRRCYSNGSVYETHTDLEIVSGKPNKYETHQQFDVEIQGMP